MDRERDIELMCRSFYEQRKANLLADGYHLRFEFIMMDGSFYHCHLFHHNGNRVKLWCRPHDNKFEFWRNNILSYECKMY